MITQKIFFSKQSGTCSQLFKRMNKSQFAGLSKQNYNEKIGKINGKISKLRKLIVKGGNLIKTRNVKD